MSICCHLLSSRFLVSPFCRGSCGRPNTNAALWGTTRCRECREGRKGGIRDAYAWCLAPFLMCDSGPRIEPEVERGSSQAKVPPDLRLSPSRAQRVRPDKCTQRDGRRPGMRNLKARSGPSVRRGEGLPTHTLAHTLTHSGVYGHRINSPGSEYPQSAVARVSFHLPRFLTVRIPPATLSAPPRPRHSSPPGRLPSPTTPSPSAPARVWRARQRRDGTSS